MDDFFLSPDSDDFLLSQDFVSQDSVVATMEFPDSESMQFVLDSEPFEDVPDSQPSRPASHNTHGVRRNLALLPASPLGRHLGCTHAAMPIQFRRRAFTGLRNARHHQTEQWSYPRLHRPAPPQLWVVSRSGLGLAGKSR